MKRHKELNQKEVDCTEELEEFDDHWVNEMLAFLLSKKKEN